MSPDVALRPTDAARLDLARLPPALPLADALRRVTETAADTLDVARAGVWLLVDDYQALRQQARPRWESLTGVLHGAMARFAHLVRAYQSEPADP